MQDKFILQFCEILKKCPSLEELNQTLKAFYVSRLISDFSVNFSDSTTKIVFSRIIKPTHIEVQGDSEFSDKVKSMIEGKKFRNEKEIKKICEDTLIQEGLYNPSCTINVSGSKITISFSGEKKIIKDITVSGSEEVLDSISKYKGASFYPALIPKIKEDILKVMRDFGYMNPQINVNFDGDNLHIDIKKGKKYILFINLGKEGKFFDLSEDKILDKIKKEFKGDFSPSEIKIFVEDYLRSKGVRTAKVSVKEAEIDKNLYAISIEINFPQMVYLESFKIEGLKKLDESDIKKYSDIREKNVITFFYPRYGLYYKDEIDNLIPRIYDFARKKGFFEFRIKDVRKKFSGDNVSITVFVDEGERAVIDNIFLKLPENTEKKIKVPKTPLFYDKDIIEGIRKKILDALMEQGYDPNIAIREDWRSENLVDIYFVYTGSPAKKIAKYILIDSKTNTKFLKDIAEIQEGTLITNKKLETAYTNLINTGYFDYVDIKAFSIGIQDSVKHQTIVMDLKEGKQNELEVSVGLSSLEGIRGGFNFTRKNISYWGLDFSTGIRSAYWIFPFGREMGITSLGFRVEISRKKLFFKTDTSLLFMPMYESTFLYNIQKPFVLSLNLSRYYRDIRITNSFSYESRRLLSWQGFTSIPESANMKNIFSFLQMFSFRKPFFISLKNEVILFKGVSDIIDLSGEYYNLRKFWGFGFAFSIGRIFLKDIFYVPVERRFFLGGFKGPRGYAEMSIYPRASYEEFRKKSLNKVLLMTEIFSPKISFLRTYAFFDIGAVFFDSQNLNFLKGVGPGLLAETPFGYLRLELGYGIDRKIFMVHFFLGLNRFTF